MAQPTSLSMAKAAQAQDRAGYLCEVERLSGKMIEYINRQIEARPFQGHWEIGFEVFGISGKMAEDAAERAACKFNASSEYAAELIPSSFPRSLRVAERGA